MSPTIDIHESMNAIHGAAGADLPERLAAVDLNLLVALDALARERSVTRAAKRLGVTQSAMSHALRRLRALFADPLMVRGRGGMALTPRAEALVAPVRSGLVALGRALSDPDAFEPRSARRAFCLSSPDLFDALAVPPLLERARREAPGVDLAVVAPNERTLARRLETGEIDLAVVPRIDTPRASPWALEAPGLVCRTLFRDRFVCVLRAGHPALGAGRDRRHEPRLSLERFVSLSHALVSPGGEGRGVVDLELERRGLGRRVALRVPNFYTALVAVAKSDLVLTAPSALRALWSSELPLVALRSPLALPRHSLNLFWHERFSNDPGHRWLRTLMTEVAHSMWPRGVVGEAP